MDCRWLLQAALQLLLLLGTARAQLLARPGGPPNAAGLSVIDTADVVQGVVRTASALVAAGQDAKGLFTVFG